MSMVSRSEWLTCTRTASLSHALIETSPAKLLMSRRVPFWTCTVWSVWVTTIKARRAVASIGVILRGPKRPALRSAALSGPRSIRVARQRRRAAEQIELLAPRFDQMAREVAVAGVVHHGPSRLVDGAIDDLQVLFDDRD